jgi:saccharopine dehydrogenase (NAD+, L-lysine-forming)
MKVLILGGCGTQGSSAARELIKHEDVSQVILADKKVDLAKVHETVRSSEKISTLTLDVADSERLVNIIIGNDVVINSVGPYWRFGVQTVKAAIAAGVNYIDICDNCNVSKEIFELDESAKKAGVSICTGFGGSPGITNILAKYAADKLDEVDEIGVFWAVAVNDAFGVAGLTQAMSQFIGDVVQYIDGHWIEVAAGSGSEEVTFMEPAGKGEVYYAAHPEAVTLPRFIPGIRTVIEKGGFLPTWVSKKFMEFIDLGLVATEPLVFENIPTTSRDLMVSVVQNASKLWEQVEQYTYSPANVVVKGKEGRKSVTYTYRFGGRGAAGIAILNSMCARMLYQGEIQAKGVLAPEGIADPQKFLGELVKRGAHFSEEKTVEQKLTF